MLDYDTAWAEQKDIAQLAAPMKAPGFERYWANENYGFSIILKAFSDYPMRQPVEALIPHGVYLVDQVSRLESAAPVASVLCYPEYLDRPWMRAGKKVIPMASPFLYAREYMRNKGVLREDIDRSGTLFMPTHSTDGIKMKADFGAIADRLLELPDHMQPVMVSVHWYDHSKNLHKPFADRGIPLVCAGSLSDPAFLVRLIHLMSRFSFVGVNTLSSPLFYAPAAGCESFLLDMEYTVEFKDKQFEKESHPKPSAERQAYNEDLKVIFARLDDDVRDRKVGISDYLLRADQLKEPDGLLIDLKLAESTAHRK
jgi:hypothetical protein